MAVAALRYHLADGFIDNWLVAGPQVIPASGLEGVEADMARSALTDRYAAEESGITEMPIERCSLSEGTFTVGDYTGAWSYVRCPEDHFVDLSAFYPEGSYLREWAYAQVVLPTAQTVTLTLVSDGPSDVWVNGERVQRDGDGGRVSFAASLAEGRNEVLVCFSAFGIRATAHRMALCLVDLIPENEADIEVVVPTTIEPLAERRELERVFNGAYLDQAVYRWNDRIDVKWDPAVRPTMSKPFIVRLRTPDGRIYGEAPVSPMGNLFTSLGAASTFPDRFYHAVLMPGMESYAVQNMRFTRTLPFWGCDNNQVSDSLYGTLPERRGETLRSAARYDDDIYAELAKMAIGWWTYVDSSVIRRAIADVQARKAGSARDLLGLLLMSLKFAGASEFPGELKAPLVEAVLGYRYWLDEPGDDVMDFAGESRSFLFHTCEILAGQLYPDATFVNTQQTGAWHVQQAQQRAMDWLKAHAAHGFAAWDSDVALEEILSALIGLEEAVEDDDVWEMASAMLDKVLFSIALNTYKGTVATTRGATSTGQLLNGALSPLSGVTRLLWGMGAFNDHTMGAVTLACAEEYGFPRLIQEIGNALPDALWNQEHHGPPSGEGGVDKVLYRTPDYALSAALDYRPGEAGQAEHVWQATLGPAAQVFVNHPASAGIDDAVAPNFWRGNAVLPRVAQWQDVLIAVHTLPEDDWMGFTHAYFPVHAFDGYVIRDGWAFAQKGDGYLALTAQQGLQFAETGPHAGRELRSYGSRNVWVCHMGRAATDGSFAEFQDAILALDIAFNDLAVRMGTLRGETLAFGWEGPLTRDGETVPQSGFRHYESDLGYAEYPAEGLIVMHGEQAMRVLLA